MTAEITKQNRKFWNELCGTKFARQLGIDQSDKRSLAEYDNWYFEYYPYLLNYIPLHELKGRKVLEIGLGFGSLSQKIIDAGAHYFGLDIAHGPADIVDRRIRFSNGRGSAIVGSILEPPFMGASFDVIVSIGCFHHTGDIENAIQTCHQLLRPSGRLILMVYNALSFRRFRQAFFATFGYMLGGIFGRVGVAAPESKKEIAAYDTNTRGESAPHTVWISKRVLKKYCENFTNFSATLENINKEFPFSFWKREDLLKTRIPGWVGLDIYATMQK